MTKDLPNNTETKEFKTIKKLSPFVQDPHNTRGGKSGGVVADKYGVKGKKMNVAKFKGGSGGDR